MREIILAILQALKIRLNLLVRLEFFCFVGFGGGMKKLLWKFLWTRRKKRVGYVKDM